MLIIKDYELFYREFVSEYEKLVAQDIGTKYQFTNPKTVLIDEDDKDSNIKYFSGGNIFDVKKNIFYKSHLQVMRECVDAIETYLSKNSSIIIRGRRFSGKTFVLSILAERYQKYTVLFFPSESTIDEDVLCTILKNSTDAVFLFDSNSLSDNAYRLVAHSEALLKKSNNKLVIATNTNDNTYLSDTLNTETIVLPSAFKIDELKKMESPCDRYGLNQRKLRETNIDYLKKLASVDKGIHNKTTKYGLPTY